MANAVVVTGGGYATVRAARQRGERGLQVAPTRQLVRKPQMKFRTLPTMLALISLTSASLAASTYAGQESREIKSLSPEDVGALLSGKGMGFAKAAELNGFGGPAHVLDLAAQLELNTEQRERTEALFASMSQKASLLGRALVEKKRELDGLFVNRTVTPESLTRKLQEIGALTAQVRDAHLEAHLAQIQILTPEQNARYGVLRGYGANAQQGNAQQGQPGHKH